MKKVLLVVVMLVMSLVFAICAFAQAVTTPTRSTPAKKAQTPKSMQYVGTIVLVDATAKGIVVNGRNGEMTFDVSMTAWKPYKSVHEVKLGDPVTVWYIEKNGEMKASSVTKANPPSLKEESIPANK